jgi:diadenosine tetraphosphate (Ap4A) HIT family hydrolase
MNMALIFQSENFKVESVDKPLVDRSDGGHIAIHPKVNVVNRQQLSASLAIELMRLTMVAGEAMDIVMNKHGVDIGRINYQDNGNWTVFHPDGPHLHIHVYGRAKSAVIQKYGQSLYFPHRDEQPEFYESLTPLTNDDVEEINSTMIKLFKEERYSNVNWNL